MTIRLYPRATAEKLKLLLADEKKRFELLTATKTKPSMRVNLLIRMSHERAMQAGFRGSTWDWEDRLKS